MSGATGYVVSFVPSARRSASASVDVGKYSVRISWISNCVRVCIIHETR